MSVSVPSLALNSAVFETLRRTKLREGSGPAGFLRSLVNRLTEEEASLFPSSLGLVLPLLSGDVERLRFAAQVAVSFDFFEVAPQLVAAARRVHDLDLLLDAASLAANPGTNRTVKEAAEELPELAPTQEFAQMVRARLASDGEETNEKPRTTLWPGLDADRSPVVAIDAGTTPALEYLRLLADLYDAGLLVRRVPEVWAHSVDSNWLSRRTPIITWHSSTLSLLRRGGFEPINIVQAPRLNAATRRSILGRLAVMMPVGLLTPSVAPSETVQSLSPLDPRVFGSGTFDALELAFLGGGSKASVYRLAKDSLTPVRHRATGHPIWRFNQLVAFRTWRYLTATTGVRPRKSLLNQLLLMAEAESVAVAGFTSDGRVVERRGDDYIDLETKQVAIGEVIELDRVFEVFELGGGRVPHLIYPSPRVKVHPRRLGGAPALVSHRITARRVAELARRHSSDAISKVYPDVDPSELQEALEVGNRMLATS